MVHTVEPLYCNTHPLTPQKKKKRKERKSQSSLKRGWSMFMGLFRYGNNMKEMVSLKKWA